MTISNISRLCTAFREKREALGLEIEKMAEELGISAQTIQSIEANDWSEVPSGGEYPLVVQIAKRLDIDLRNHPVSKSSFIDSYAVNEIQPSNLARERIVMVVMTIAVVLVLAWLLVPAKGLVQYADKDTQKTHAASTFWQKPDSDQPYPVLGEVFPESPITADGVLISLRATDFCDARIVMENRHEQNQTLRMSEPWKLRIQGPFVLSLDNAGVVVVEVAGHRIQHGVGVGQHWSGSFDSNGVWLRPLPRPAPPKIDVPATDEGGGNAPAGDVVHSAGAG
jgi:transcriptional regulator with XRE-family HTH domain